MGNEPQNAKPIMKKMLVEMPAGAELTPSKKVPGASSPLVHGPDGVSSQVVLHEIPSKMTKFMKSGYADFLLDLAVAAAIAGGEAAIKHGVPKFKQYLAERRATATAEAPARESTSSTVAFAEPGVVETSNPGDDIVETDPSLSSDQWFQLFFDAVAHGVAGKRHEEISAEKWRELASARIADDPATQELARAMRELLPEEVSVGVDRVLKEHPELRNEDPIVLLQRLFDDDARPTKQQSLEPDADEEDDPSES
ncbi:hypothetical protein ITJ43_11060 [Microbacterium sp. VKM Ac-2870]|uniref:hypothetical protein n=1 Tax=Microbacterium sp. VKM Ac-2870 TaxID=2783825 RepID=UPI00188C80B1|nr:hypothetical protein [Microbacterium sp. VKM Ac-2870]MBF4562678.1 hypothetical protein [Microbacterium sp. VKM Ac-2870]